ncbi:hypothetical protein J2S28_001650 [Rhizobium sp. SLBN-94]|nr:hypothetical protein [Rhizobium sp. SLBN-94]
MTSQDREMLEMVRLANEVAIQIRDAEFDWQALSKIYTVTGNGSLSAFPLPDDYCRMTVAGNIWSSRWSWGLNKVPSLDEWIEKQVVPYTSVTGDWIIFGNELNIQPVMAGTEYVKFPYISNLIVKPATGDMQDRFATDSDTFRLSEHALELGIIWAYRSQKGVASDDDEVSFQKALYTAMNTDKGAKPIISGNRHRFNNVKVAFPFKVIP